MNGLKALKMKNKENIKEENSLNNSNQERKNLVKITRIILLIGIILTSCFIIYEIIKVEPGYYTYGLLNSDGYAQDYPTQVKKSKNITLYATVGNYLKTDFSFSIHILKGNNNTWINKDSGSNGTLIRKLPNITLQHGNEWISDAQNISFSNVGLNKTIIFELWKIENNLEIYVDILFIKLKVTEI